MRTPISLLTALVGTGLVLAAGAQAQTTERVSIASDGTQGNHRSQSPAISADGRFVAFLSEASNLVLGDTNGWSDIFVHDRDTGVTERVSVASDGTQGNRVSHGAAISADGRFVAFHSIASNLVSGDTIGRDIFVHDRDTGVTERVSVASDGTEGNDISFNPAISADGRFVAFLSEASNLVLGDTNDVRDIFVHDRDTGVTERVNVAGDGTEANAWSSSPAISADGRFVAFDSSASNLVAGDTNVQADIFIHDRDTGTTERVSVASDGTEGDGHSFTAAISADGRFVAFISRAANLLLGDTNDRPDIFVHDRDTGTTERVSVASDGGQANSSSFEFAISADGGFVAFRSHASNLVSGDTNGEYDVFIHDRVTGTTERVSVATGGSQGNFPSWVPAISADGRFVAFYSGSSLVSGDTNSRRDVFVHDREFDGGPPQLAILGACPGTVSVSVTDAAPNGRVAFAGSAGEGSFTQPSDPCAGVELGLDAPDLLGVLRADNSAAIAHDEDVGVDTCGLFVQAVDLTTCQPSNVASVP